MQLEIKGPSVLRNITRRSDGKQFTFREQVGLFSQPNGEVLAVQVSLENDQADYPPGVYQIEAQSFYVKNGKFEQRRNLALVPAKTDAPRLQAAK